MNKKRVLGDEWFDWNENSSDANTAESKNTFLLLSLIVLAAFVSIVLLFWYLILPRFELFGRLWTVIITAILAALALLLIVWYLVLFIAVIYRKRYMNVCLTHGSRLFFVMLPLVFRLASMIGISKDRLSHSFIRVSNTLAGSGRGSGPVLVLLPRCLRKDIRKEAESVCGQFPGVIFHVAPGGTEARRIIAGTSPGAIVAIACERDLISGIQDVAPRIPVIGVPNTRPEGPCTDTEIKIDELRQALDYFHNQS
jgi:hypothetical protein